MQSFEVIWKLTHILAEKFVNNSIYADNLTKIRLKVTVFQDQWDFYEGFSFSLIGIFRCFRSLDTVLGHTFNWQYWHSEKRPFCFILPTADGISHIGANLLTFIIFQIWYSPFHKKCLHSAIKAWIIKGGQVWHSAPKKIGEEKIVKNVKK